MSLVTPITTFYKDGFNTIVFQLYLLILIFPSVVIYGLLSDFDVIVLVIVTILQLWKSSHFFELVYG